MIRTLLVGLLGLGLILSLGTLVSADHMRQLDSDHFLIYYTAGTGSGTVTTDYATLVLDALEEAYSFLIEQTGFGIFDGVIEVNILESEGGEMGAEYITYTAEGDPYPVIEIATLLTMEENLNEMIVPCSLEDMVRSTAAHELFHVVQDYLALCEENDMSDLIFIEAFATWAQEAVVPEANDYIEPALDFLLGPDSIAFFHRTYGAGIFWVFVSARHGGTEVIQRVMRASADYEGRCAIDQAFRNEGRTFDDLWEEFAVALATGDIPDADLVRTLFPLPGAGKSQQSEQWADLPSPVYTGIWSGSELCIDQVNFESEASYTPAFEEDPIGAPLRVAHAYGIDFLHLVSTVDQTMKISFAGDQDTDFRVNVVVQQGSVYTTYRLAFGAPVQIEYPNTYDDICIVVTRGDAGTGTYSLTVR